MDIEEELIRFLPNLPRKVGQPRMDGSPRKTAEPDPILRGKNHEVILSYYGFGAGNEFWPTYEELGLKHEGLIFGDRKHGECAICQQEYSRRALIVAQKKKRSRCAGNERLDSNIVFPLCIFGRDYLYEHRFVRVEEGRVVASRATLSRTEKAAAKELIGTTLKAPWSDGPPTYFLDE